VTAAQDEARVDTRDMVVVHGALRREFRLASGVVRQCPEGDLERGWLPTISALSCGSFTSTTPAKPVVVAQAARPSPRRGRACRAPDGGAAREGPRPHRLGDRATDGLVADG